MHEIKLNAPAKINLTLDLISKRFDGYHNISSIMQTVSLFDSIIIKKTILPGVKVFSNISWLPTDKNNLAYKIADDLINQFHLDYGVTIKIFKRIPIGAGLAGGSADCATVLKGMIKLFNLPISKYQACKICEKYGADVPFCFMGGTILTNGIGNVLKQLANHPPAVILLAKPKFSVPTAKIYTLADQQNFLPPTSKKMVYAIKTYNIKKIATNLSNALENITASLYPEILQIKNIMLENKSLGSCMSGSGPTVFGYFEIFRTAKKAAAQVEKNFPGVTTFLAEIFNG